MKPFESILITGAAGLLGRHFLKRLSGRYEIYAVVRNLPIDTIDSVKYIVADLAVDLDHSLFPRRVDAVVHLAQSGDARAFPEQARDIFMVNAGATASLLDYAYKSGARSFLLASTGGLYQNSETPLKEDAVLADGEGALSYYFSAKRCAELLTLRYGGILRTTIIRPFFIYGPGQRKDMLIPRLFDNILKSSSIPVKGGKGAIINPIFAEDAAEALFAILTSEHAPQFVNLAGPEKVSIRQIASEIGRLVGKEPVFVLEAGNGVQLVADIALLTGLMSKPMRSVSCGLRETFGHSK